MNGVRVHEYATQNSPVGELQASSLPVLLAASSS